VDPGGREAVVQDAGVERAHADRASAVFGSLLVTALRAKGFGRAVARSDQRRAERRNDARYLMEWPL
jgi:hypothetical protein